MLPTPKNYAIWPSVMLADVPTEMTITPTERAFLFFEGEEYRITVAQVNADEDEYRSADTLRHRTYYTVTAHNGILKFTHTYTSGGSPDSSYKDLYSI